MVTLSFLAMWAQSWQPPPMVNPDIDLTPYGVSIVRVCEWWKPCCEPVTAEGGGLICKTGCRIDFSCTGSVP